MAFTSIKQSGSWCHCLGCSFARPLQSQIILGIAGAGSAECTCPYMCIVPSVQSKKQHPLQWHGKHAGSLHKMVMAQIIATTLCNNIAFLYFHVFFSVHFLNGIPLWKSFSQLMRQFKDKRNGTIHSTQSQIIDLICKHIYYLTFVLYYGEKIKDLYCI